MVNLVVATCNLNYYNEVNKAKGENKAYGNNS